VQTVDPRLSLAITWSNADFRASAMTVDGSAFGIIAAHLGSGADRYLLELRGVPFRNELRPGTAVVTSGLGGVYPEGIPVGTVLRELQTSEGWARTYLVRPAVIPSEVSSVMILRPERVDAGVRGVWTSPKAADSAARRVVAAADSIVSDSVRAVARRRALDSARVAATAAAAVAATRADSARRAAATAGAAGATGTPGVAATPARRAATDSAPAARPAAGPPAPTAGATPDSAPRPATPSATPAPAPPANTDTTRPVAP